MPVAEGTSDAHDISKDFFVVNILGCIVFTPIFLCLICGHIGHVFDKEGILTISAIGMMVSMFCWFVYFLTMNIFRLRHAGKVCSGDYLPDRLNFYEDADPYIHDNGAFLWYATTTQWLFWVVMGTGLLTIADLN